MNLIDFITAGGMVGITIALVQAFKGLPVPKKYYPMLAVGIGTVLTVFIGMGMGGDFWATLLTGLGVGLAAAGTYDQKAIFFPTKKVEPLAPLPTTVPEVASTAQPTGPKSNPADQPNIATPQ